MIMLVLPRQQAFGEEQRRGMFLPWCPPVHYEQPPSPYQHTQPPKQTIYICLSYSFSVILSNSSPDNKFLLLFRSVVQCIDHVHAIVSDLLLLSFKFKLLLACVWAVVLVAVPIICVLVVGSSVYVVVHADLIAVVPFPFIFILSTVLLFVFVSYLIFLYPFVSSSL